MSKVGIVCFDAGGCAVRVLAREAQRQAADSTITRQWAEVYGDPIEVIFRVLEPAETLPAFTTTIPEEEEKKAMKLKMKLLGTGTLVKNV